jgi:hypothetical protein
MQKLSRNIFLFSLAFLSLLLISWGHNGHVKINQDAPLSFTPEMQQFMSWGVTLAEHASDADNRKDIDPTEEYKHYLDLENYPGFIAGGRIPQTYDSVVALYGVSFVTDNGTLPWATKAAYDTLVNCFARFDWSKAVLVASDIGHYVADGHQPLHITANYNGQFTGNYDIHSRYETSMINSFQSQIPDEGDDLSLITDINGFIFSYLYANHVYVDSIMLADDYATGVAGNTNSYAYKSALWEKTGGFTKQLFHNASNIIARMIYTAWVEAGKPDMNSGPGIFEFMGRKGELKMNLTPNPVKDVCGINFTLKGNSDIKLIVSDIKGEILKNIINENLPAGFHEFRIDLSDLPEGIYFMNVESGNYLGTAKFIKLRD